MTLNIEKLVGSMTGVNETKLKLIKKEIIGRKSLVIYHYDESNKRNDLIAKLNQNALNNKDIIFLKIPNLSKQGARISKYNRNLQYLGDLPESESSKWDKLINNKIYDINYTLAGILSTLATKAKAEMEAEADHNSYIDQLQEKDLDEWHRNLQGNRVPKVGENVTYENMFKFGLLPKEFKKYKTDEYGNYIVEIDEDNSTIKFQKTDDSFEIIKLNLIGKGTFTRTYEFNEKVVLKFSDGKKFTPTYHTPNTYKELVINNLVAPEIAIAPSYFLSPKFEYSLYHIRCEMFKDKCEKHNATGINNEIESIKIDGFNLSRKVLEKSVDNFIHKLNIIIKDIDPNAESVNFKVKEGYDLHMKNIGIKIKENKEALSLIDEDDIIVSKIDPEAFQTQTPESEKRNIVEEIKEKLKGDFDERALSEIVEETIYKTFGNYRYEYQLIEAFKYLLNRFNETLGGTKWYWFRSDGQPEITLINTKKVIETIIKTLYEFAITGFESNKYITHGLYEIIDKKIDWKKKYPNVNEAFNNDFSFLKVLGLK